MIRRGWLSFALIVGSMTGCGMAVRKADEETLAAATTAVRSLASPPHRVAFATFEVMRSEMSSAEFARDSEFSPDPGLLKRDGSPVKEGELPPTYPAFWLEWKNNKGEPARAMVSLKAASFKGIARDGRPVDVGIVAQGDETLLKIRFDKLGDRMFSQDLAEKVSQRLNHPTYLPGSLDEANALKAFFGGVASREALASLRKAAEASK